MKRTLTVTDARALARIINLAARCGCVCAFMSGEHHGDTSYYHVVVELTGRDESLRLLDAQIDRVLAYENEVLV